MQIQLLSDTQMKNALYVISLYNSGASHGYEWCLCQRKRYSFSEFLQGRQTLRDLKREYPTATACDIFVFAKMFFRGRKFCPRDMLHEMQPVWIRAPQSRGKTTLVFTVSLSLLLQTVPLICILAYRWSNLIPGVSHQASLLERTWERGYSRRGSYPHHVLVCPPAELTKGSRSESRREWFGFYRGIPVSNICLISISYSVSDRATKISGLNIERHNTINCRIEFRNSAF